MEANTNTLTAAQEASKWWDLPVDILCRACSETAGHDVIRSEVYFPIDLTSKLGRSTTCNLHLTNKQLSARRKAGK